MRHSVEQLSLLQQYIVICSVGFGFPSIDLLLKEDHRYLTALIIYISLIIIFIILYITGNKIFFPEYTLAKIVK